MLVSGRVNSTHPNINMEANASKQLPVLFNNNFLLDSMKSRLVSKGFKKVYDDVYIYRVYMHITHYNINHVCIYTCFFFISI